MTRFLFLLFLPVTCLAQTSDILLVQKNHRTVRSFFPGSNITFYTREHQAISATIDKIERDSIFLIQYNARMVPNGFGTFALDTLGFFNLAYSLADIQSFPAPGRKFGFITNGTLFMVGGAAYLILNLVNTTREKEPVFGKDNLPRVLGGTAALALGLILNRTQRTEIKLGKKYQLKYIPMKKPAIE